MVLGILLATAYIPTARAAALTAAIFPWAFVDTSLEAAQPAELVRLHETSQELRKLLAQSNRYAIVDTAPIATEIEHSDIVDCQPCAVSLAKQLGAEVAVTAWVQKVSNLILNINAVIRSTATGDVVSAGSVDIRGNTNESWLRGVRYLVANRLLAAPP